MLWKLQLLIKYIHDNEFFCQSDSRTIWKHTNVCLLPGPRAYHGTATIDHMIYVVGGFDGMDYFNSVRCFDPQTKEWTEVAPMNAKR